MRVRLLLLGSLAVSLAACERGMHEMYDQAKYKPLAPATLFADGNSSRPQVPGTVPHSAGTAAATSSGRNGTMSLPRVPGAAVVPYEGGNSPTAGSALAPGYSNPLPITAALLARGRERFNIYCAPCHSESGDGDGMIVRRGFPAPPSYHTDRLRNAPDSHFYDVITNGYGVMYPYADRIPSQDRWAIIAYIRALQLSQHVPVTTLDAAQVEQLRESGR